jgi:predicted murein hydrolase (TIGR00659 family)
MPLMEKRNMDEIKELTGICFETICRTLLCVLLILLLLATDTPYKDYFAGAQFVHFLLGPATVALAIPLYRQWSCLKRHPIALAVSLLTGSLTAVLSAVFIAKLGGVGNQALVSIAPKSVTTPVAMGISEQLGGLPSLTAVVVILTGILGAALGPWLLDKLHITNPMAQGLAMGTASHGIGTGRAIYMGDVAAAFSGLAMGLNGLATTILLPAIWGWLMN